MGQPELVRTTAYQSGTLQGAYLIIAARALGLDCGPMGGFDNAKVDATFFPEGKVKSNFLCNLGYGDPAKLHARAPRLAFDDACQHRVASKVDRGSDRPDVRPSPHCRDRDLLPRNEGQVELAKKSPPGGR